MRKLLISAVCLLCYAGSLAVEKQTFVYAVKQTDTLRLDLYRVESERPVPCVMFVFGGGFVSGTRDAKTYESYFDFLNDEGYSVVSIDYRLGLKNLGDEDMGITKIIPKFKRAVDMAVEDMYDATAFVVEHAREWNIDPKAILSSGSSAGAITVLQAEKGVVNRTELSQRLPEGFNYAGVMSFAGAIVAFGERPSWHGEPCPILFFHGDADSNVPYGKVGFKVAGFYGSAYLVGQLDKINAPYFFYSAENVDHSMAITPMNDNREQIMLFLNEYVKEHRRLQTVERVKDLSLPELPEKFKMKDFITSNFTTSQE